MAGWQWRRQAPGEMCRHVPRTAVPPWPACSASLPPARSVRCCLQGAAGGLEGAGWLGFGLAVVTLLMTIANFITLQVGGT